MVLSPEKPCLFICLWPNDIDTGLSCYSTEPEFILKFSLQNFYNQSKLNLLDSLFFQVLPQKLNQSVNILGASFSKNFPDLFQKLDQSVTNLGATFSWHPTPANSASMGQLRQKAFSIHFIKVLFYSKKQTPKAMVIPNY